MKKALTVGLVVTLLLIFALPAMAGEADEENLVVPPGSASYFAQQIVDKVQWGLSRGADQRAAIAADVLERRMAEMGIVAARGQTEHVGYLAQQTVRVMDRIAEALGRAKGRPEVDVTDGAIAVLEVATTAEDTLATLIEKAEDGDMPEEALEGLETALLAVQGGRAFALGILEGIFNGDFPGDADRAGETLRGPFDDERPGRGRANGTE